MPDALVEFWQASLEGSGAEARGSMRRDPVTGAVLGRHGVDFTGFGRVAVDPDGRAAGHPLALPEREGAYRFDIRVQGARGGGGLP